MARWRDVEESAQRLASIVESSDYAIIGKTLDGIITSWNQGAEALYGYSAEEMVGASIARLIPEDRLDELSKILQWLRRGERLEDFETQRVRKDGTRRDVTLSIAPICNASGEFVGASTIARDITAQKRTSEALQESERRLNAVLDNATVSVFLMDDRQHCIYMNRAAELLTGYTLTETAGRPLHDVVHHTRPDGSPYPLEECPIDRAFPTNNQEQGEEYFVDKAGRFFPVAYTASPIRDDHARVTGTIIEVRDITERKRAEEALREADRRKDEFLAILGHELRNPLASLSTALEITRMSTDRQTLEDCQKMMKRQLEHLTRLVDDVLDVARITQGKLHLKKQHVELAALVSGAVEDSRERLDAAGHRLEVRLPPEPVWLDADPVRMGQVLTNLLSNAAKYTPEGGLVELTAAAEGESVCITVRDNGLGIPPEMISSVFELFAQLDRSLETGFKGLGIGLNLVESLVEMHGGEIEVRSEGEGRGSEFEVRLRRAGAPRTTAVAPGPAPCSGAGLRVLVVDDNLDVARAMAKLIELLGHDVRTAFDGMEALETVSEYGPQLVLLDLGLPRLNGYEVARHLRARSNGEAVRLIAVSGWGQESDRQRALEAGFDQHLTKPVDFAALRALLGEIVEA